MKQFHEDLYNKLIEKFEMIKINNQIINEELNNTINFEYTTIPQLFPVTNSSRKINSNNISEIYDMTISTNLEIIEYFKDFRDYSKFIKNERYGKILFNPHMSETIIDLGIIFNKIKEKYKNFYYFFNFRFTNFSKSNYIAICIYENQVITFIECKKKKNNLYKKYYSVNLLLSIQLGFNSILFNNTKNIESAIITIINSPNKEQVITQTEYDIYEDAKEIAELYKPYYEIYTKKYQIKNS